MINPNEMSQAMYASNVLQSTRAGQGGVFNFAKEMENEDKKNRLK